MVTTPHFYDVKFKIPRKSLRQDWVIVVEVLGEKKNKHITDIKGHATGIRGGNL